MNIKLYSILDVKAQLFSQVYQARNDYEAYRMYDRLRKDEKSSLFQYPDDYALYYLGDFNDSTGVLSQKELPQLVVLSQ